MTTLEAIHPAMRHPATHRPTAARHPALERLSDPGLVQTDALIDGAWLGADARFAVQDPATGQIVAQVAAHGHKAAKAAITAAERALPTWRALPARERAAVLQRWHQLLLQHQEDLALLLTLEQGKPLAEARGELVYGASFIAWFAEEARRLYGETVPTTDADKRYLVIRQPIGVCAAITPWNFPVAMVTRKVAPALAAGCTVVLKPAEATPLSALALAELARRAGLPPGVLNVVPADASHAAEVGQAWCESPVVRHLSFTGSTEVGRILMRQCADTIKKLSLELGGNAPFIVFDDAELEAAVDGAVAAKFRNTGQTCVCANRLYVQAGIHDAFTRRLAEKVQALRVGNGLDLGVQQGPLIDAAALAKVQAHVADALALGARVLCGGMTIGERFHAPTVLVGATAAMRCAQEESFGPLAPVFRFETEAEVLRSANAAETGLAAYLYSRDIGRIFRVAEALEVGMVGINTGIISTAEVPFGGVKQSGLGREGARQGLDDYTETKYLCLGGLSHTPAPAA
jgi:succinate-semialdehyde dehydrogenase/glutarate-semialdehyde dehydrogenase